jgi:hypothetical protein
MGLKTRIYKLLFESTSCIWQLRKQPWFSHSLHFIITDWSAVRKGGRKGCSPVQARGLLWVGQSNTSYHIPPKQFVRNQWSAHLVGMPEAPCKRNRFVGLQVSHGARVGAWYWRTGHACWLRLKALSFVYVDLVDPLGDISHGAGLQQNFWASVSSATRKQNFGTLYRIPASNHVYNAGYNSSHETDVTLLLCFNLNILYEDHELFFSEKDSYILNKMELYDNSKA